MAISTLRPAPVTTASAAQPSHSQAPVTVGLLMPAEAIEAASFRQGAALAIEEANRSSMCQARLAVRGRPGQWGTEGGEAAALALDESVAGIITPSAGTAAHEILQVAGRTRVPVISLCPDSSVTAAGVPWAVRIVPRTEEEAGTIFRGTRQRRAMRWAAIVPPERAGREATHDLQAAAKAAGCELFEPVQMLSGSNEVNHLIKAVLVSVPDGVLVWLGPEGAAEWTRALREEGFHGTVAGPARLNSNAFLQRAGKSAEGFIVAAVASATTSNQSLEFSGEYRQRFGTEPDLTAVMAYDAALLLVLVVRQSDVEHAYMRFPLQARARGASGPIQFDRSGNREVPLILMVCEEGQFVTLPGQAEGLGPYRSIYR